MRKTQHFLPVDTNYINQQNPEERSSQIQFMKTILEQNAAVYAWLGLPTEDTSMAFEKLEEFSKVVAGRLFHQFLDERCVGGVGKDPCWASGIKQLSKLHGYR